MAFAPVEGLDNFPGGGKKQIPSLRYGMTSKGRSEDGRVRDVAGFSINEL